ncbi:MAG: DNA gyrase/topoisomerase IV subunit A [Saprospiraceae bacterium]|nr:DNA gyrase/topoisomerase IV subunit A [Saprospiraceae bacterium]HMW37820.1 DNA gyrase/topoisomerase IV subunit A [Saprospiraceae bacterium]HMX87506.1 DNA gyrase/topoisomerase IV subunit A [Saprospiraceae bacterium]HMZ39616.1 DNA gyrase/topoisomerase IV subunit A [Saprospiraceae bacterium]HNA63731.1 DNA gyrase/topoisomerase IV subunit A [Saprospiraceae bacterium]
MKPTISGDDHLEDHIITLHGMYQDYFLDYASYVILERAVPAIEDGLKPVQRRILHSMFEKEDGRYHKVANLIGHTMQYHPHGDAAISEALVNLGQKNLLIDTQGNWGDYRTGDSAAAPRYIEARLTKFALDVAFNKQTTEWQLSYDGRNKEPVTLPMKFPLLLAQGVEGIAVGLATRILPHNFIELIKASVQYLKGTKVKIYPDFETGGILDVSEYDQGRRGGKVKVRARIEIEDKKTLVIKELPYSVTTTSLIESIVKASEKGKIKIKQVSDNTARDVEIRVELQPGVSPEVTMDALYAFTSCEVSISTNACVIVDNKPLFLSVQDILRISVENTKKLLGLELQIKRNELQEKWHLTSLEKIFIENRIYRDIEDCTSFQQVITVIHKGLEQFVATPSTVKAGMKEKRLLLNREITEDDIIHLTEIRIKRISKYNKFNTDEQLKKLEQEISETEHHLNHLTEFTIAYYEDLLARYGAGRERKTKITELEAVQAVQVVANNARLYVNRADGFVGFGLKKDEFIKECSDLDDIIVLRADAKFVVTRIAEKTFVGKDILFADVWKKADERTTYNLIYLDGETGRAMAKRFNITGITRDKEYDLSRGHPKSKTLYLSVNPEGEAEVVNIQLTSGCSARIKNFDFDFSEIEIKGRSSQGNIVTKYPIRKVMFKEKGKSTLVAQEIWFDTNTGRFNTEGRGLAFGALQRGEKLIALYRNGTYEIMEYDFNLRLAYDELLKLEKFHEEDVISAIYFEGEKKWTMAKRFKVETTSLQQRFSFISEHRESKLYYVTTHKNPEALITYKNKKEKVQEIITLKDFVDVKGWKAIGNKIEALPMVSVTDQSQQEKQTKAYKPGDSIEF